MTTQPEGDYVPEWTDGDKLRKVRRHLGMTQAEFADLLQVNAITYGAWESDRNRIKDLRTIAQRIKILTGTPLWWWFDTERPDDGPKGPDGGKTTAKPDGWAVVKQLRTSGFPPPARRLVAA